MIVSAVSGQNAVSGNFNAGINNSVKKNDRLCDTSFNANIKSVNPEENLPQVLDNINAWKNFCHKQILGGKLDIIA